MRTDLDITDRWVLVCGASKGLDWGCARALALEGVNVVMVSRGAPALSQAAAALRSECALRLNSMQPQILGVAADITTEAGRRLAFAAPGGPGIDLDIVVTNAGGPPTGDFRT